MNISKAEPSELVEIMYLTKVCSIDNNSMGCMFWNYINEQIPELLVNGKIYKYRFNESTIGIIVINSKIAEEYHHINWNYNNGKYIPVRILVHPKWKEKGICYELLRFAEEFALQNGYQVIRLDTDSENHFAINVLEETKYKKAGELHLPFHHTSIICFEKDLTLPLSEVKS